MNYDKNNKYKPMAIHKAEIVKTEDLMLAKDELLVLIEDATENEGTIWAHTKGKNENEYLKISFSYKE